MSWQARRVWAVRARGLLWAIGLSACAPKHDEPPAPPAPDVETRERSRLFDIAERPAQAGLPQQSDEPGIGSTVPPRTAPPEESDGGTRHRVRADVVSMQGAGGPPLAALLRAKVRRCAEKLEPAAIGSLHIDFRIGRDGVAHDVVVRGIDGVAECVRRSIATSAAFTPSDVEYPISVEVVIVEQPQ